MVNKGVRICFITLTCGGMTLVSKGVDPMIDMMGEGVHIRPMTIFDSGVCWSITVTNRDMTLISGWAFPIMTMFNGCMNLLAMLYTGNGVFDEFHLRCTPPNKCSWYFYNIYPNSYYTLRPKETKWTTWFGSFERTTFLLQLLHQIR